MSDFQLFDDGGSVSLLHVLSEEGRSWVEENVGGDLTWWGGAIAIERRYVGDLLDGIAEAGLQVRL